MQSNFIDIKFFGGFMKKIILCAIFFIASVSLFAEEKYDWLFNHYWWLETSLFDMNEPPKVIFRKLEPLPEGNIMYQERLRKERFALVYSQAGNTDKLFKLFKLEDTLSNNIFELEFSNNYTSLAMRWGNLTNPLRQNRVGKQLKRDYPLVGIWGSLPNLTEYRIVNPKDCPIYMEISEQLPLWAVRAGTYLLKQIDEDTFETVSSFPDGRLRLEVESNKRIILLPLFKLPDDEDGSVDPLIIRTLFYN
jgi:hypothetical protein